MIDHQEWNPCFAHSSILNENQEVFLTKSRKEMALMKMAQTDIIVQDIMEQSKKPLLEDETILKKTALKVMRRKFAP